MRKARTAGIESIAPVYMAQHVTGLTPVWLGDGSDEPLHRSLMQSRDPGYSGVLRDFSIEAASVFAVFPAPDQQKVPEISPLPSAQS